MTNKIQVPERKPTEWELKQKPKTKTIICWATPKANQTALDKSEHKL